MNLPLDPQDLLAEAIASTSGCSIDVARREALPLTEWLDDHGAHLVYDVKLPTSAPKGDPKTAAASIENLNDRQWAVWWVLSYYGPLTDEVAVERYDAFTGMNLRTVAYCNPDISPRLLPPQSAASIRSRRAELVRAGHVYDTGEKRATSNGGQARVWAARSEAGIAAA